MSVKDICHRYFTITPTTTQRSTTYSRIALVTLKVLSYLTIITPIIMGIVYGGAILYGQITQYHINSRLPAIYKKAPSYISDPFQPVFKNLTTNMDVEQQTISAFPTDTPTRLAPSGGDKDIQPKISGFSANGIKIQPAGQNGERFFTNVILLPSSDPAQQATSWDWNRDPSHPMSYTTGMSIEDLPPCVKQQVKNRKLDVLIFSTGRGSREAPLQANTPHQGALTIQQDLQDYVTQAGIEVVVCNTAEAIRQYKQFCQEGKQVGALLHPAFSV